MGKPDSWDATAASRRRKFFGRPSDLRLLAGPSYNLDANSKPRIIDMSAPPRRAPSNFVTSEIQGATHPASHGLRSTLAGIIVNLCLAAIKGIAGVAGQSYALIADAIESLTDVFSSLIVYVGLRVAMRPPDANHPYGHGKAEPMAAVGVSIALFAAAVAIAVESIHEIRIPQRTPAPFTLLVFRLWWWPRKRCFVLSTVSGAALGAPP